VDPLLDARTLGFQTSLFKLTMKSNSKGAIEEPQDRNPLTKLWQKVNQNSLMEIAVTAVFGSVEDERTFSTLGFMKSKLHNHLGSHLDTDVKLFSQPFYKQDTFHYNSAITHWREQRARLGADQ
jgi:DNA primase large subunit